MYNTKEGKSCVIYIRVSSERQVKGYSLDGQKHYLAECAERRGMTVLDTYVEEGKSGKSIEGRTEFQRMLDDIQSGKVHTDYVLVFKLSRFGRNARDVLNSLEFIMKYGVHLMCVEDGLDSSTSMGKMSWSERTSLHRAFWGVRKKQSPAAGTAALHPMGIVW